MATQIYPGVIVPDRLQTEQFLKSRAHQFLSTYSDVRYANWQTALNIASTTYKLSMDEYKAKLKALADIDAAASKEVAAIERKISEYQQDFLTVDEKEQSLAVGERNQQSRAWASERNASARAEENANLRAKESEEREKQRKEDEAARNRTDPLRGLPQSITPEDYNNWVQKNKASGATSSERIRNGLNSLDNPTAGNAAPRGLTPEGKQAAAEALMIQEYTPNQIALAGTGDLTALGFTPDQINNMSVTERNKLEMAASGASRKVNIPPASTTNTPINFPTYGYTPTYADFTETQRARLRELYKLGGYEAIVDLPFVHNLPAESKTPEKVLELLGIEATTSELEKAKLALKEARSSRPTAPSGDLLGEARRIYSEGFEQNPYMKRRQAIVDSVGSLVSNYESKGMTPEEARNKAFDDLINFEKNQAAKGGTAVGNVASGFGDPPASNPLFYQGYGRGQPVGAAVGSAAATAKPTEQQLPATPVPTPVDNSAFFGNAPDLGPTLQDELEQLLAARAARAEAAPVAPTPVDPQQIPLETGMETGSGLRNAYKPPTPGLVPGIGAGSTAIANQQAAAARLRVPPPVVAPTPTTPSLAPMTTPPSTTGSISISGAQPTPSTGSISMTVEQALELGNPFIVRSVDGQLGYIYDPGVKAFRLTTSGGVAVTDQPPIKEGDPRWNELMNPNLYVARPMPPATEPAAPPAGPPGASGGSPRQPAAKQPPTLGNEEQRLMELLVTGTELADKPMKLNRLLNNTPAGKLVTQLMAANKKAPTSQTFLDLREEIYRAYKGKPQQIELAIELLAASFIRETKSAAEKAQTTETN